MPCIFTIYLVYVTLFTIYDLLYFPFELDLKIKTLYDAELEKM